MLCATSPGERKVCQKRTRSLIYEHQDLLLFLVDIFIWPYVGVYDLEKNNNKRDGFAVGSNKRLAVTFQCLWYESFEVTMV